MRSPIRAVLVALVATLACIMLAPSVAEAKPQPRQTHTSKVTRTKTVKSKSTSTKHVANRPWKKGHAKAQAKPQRIRKSPAAKHHPRKG